MINLYFKNIKHVFKNAVGIYKKCRMKAKINKESQKKKLDKPKKIKKLRNK